VLSQAEVRVLVAEAAAGKQAAWDALVDNFAGLVWSVIRSYGVYGADANDVFQTVWLRFVEHVHRVENPKPWLATTARHECFRVSRRAARTQPMADVPEIETPDDADAVLDAIVDAARRGSVAEAFGQLPAGCQELLRLLSTDLSYDEIAELIGRPKGSIGPTRARCLDRLRGLIAST
jgi:RNA polymerase sigma factor (sigma-70 family)